MKKKLRAILLGHMQLKQQKLGMNDYKFAEYLGIEPADLLYWKIGDYDMPLSTLFKLLSMLNLSFDFTIEELFYCSHCRNSVKSHTIDKEQTFKVIDKEITLTVPVNLQ